MMSSAIRRGVFAALAASTVLISSCMTVNNLQRYDVAGSRIAVDMRIPPEPRLNVDYDITLDSHSVVIDTLSVMANLAKANQVNRAREVLRQALVDVDVPEIIRTESFSACTAALGAEQVGSKGQADYILALEMQEWGIEARSPVSAVSLRIRLLASLYPVGGSELAWRREVTVDQPADPEMFGIGSIIGSMVTATVLSNMTAEELTRGFRELASQTARSLARELQNDLDFARSRK